MSTLSSNVNMLCLEYPRDVDTILNDTEGTTWMVDITDSPSWLRQMVHQHQQAQNDLQQLFLACGSRFDQDDHQIYRIKWNYQVLYDGVRHVYEAYSQGQAAARDWLQAELTYAANTYQDFQQEVWTTIIARTTEADTVAQHQATQIARLGDALAFIQEA